MSVLEAAKATLHRPALPALTGIRFLAAFYVVLGHSLPWLKQHIKLPSPVEIFLTNCPLAVALFFLLSGFILTYTYESQIEGARNRQYFWAARFARIYPVYVFSLILAYWFERGLPTKTYLAVLMMVQTWNPLARSMIGAWNYPAWTLSVEAFFYLCFPFILPWLLNKSTSFLRWIGITLLVFAVCLHTPVTGLGNASVTSFGGLIPLPLWRFPEFLVGVVLGLYFKRTNPQDRPGGSVRVLMLSAMIIIILSTPIGAWVSLVLVPFAALIYELACGDNWLAKLLSTRLMILLGSASYAIYLLQYPVRSWTRTIFLHLPQIVQPLGVPLSPIVLILFSMVVFVYLEEPCRKTLKSRFTEMMKSDIA